MTQVKLIDKAERLIEDRVVAMEGEVEEGMDWELGLVDVEWMDMVLLYSTWNYIQCPRVSREENQYQKQRTNCLTGHFAVEINTIL